MPLTDLRLDAKVTLLGASSALVTALALAVLAAGLSREYNALAQKEVDGLIAADLDHITTGVYNLVKTEDEAVRQLVSSDLAVAARLLAAAGGASLARSEVAWKAADQFDGGVRTLRLPRMLVGGTWLGQNDDPAAPTFFIDDVAGLVGATVTIFQRMDEEGDMIRVATNVPSSSGRRAIGTYIPARGPGSDPNPVIASVLRGEGYRGRAFVVNAFYLTAYEPLRDAAGRIIGMLYVGVKQESAESRIRQAILSIGLGKTGYVFVLTGKGENRGRYVISQHGERDGEDIWDQQDSDGRFVVREIIAKAVVLGPGKLDEHRYRWKNLEDREPRWKTARLAYFEPWDWVIGTGVYDDELQAYRSILRTGRRRMASTMALAGLGMTFLVGLLGAAVARSIAAPVRRMTLAAGSMLGGGGAARSGGGGRDEIRILSRTFDLMTERIRETVRGLEESEAKYRDIFENAIEGLFSSSFEGAVLAANPAMARMLGYDSPAEAVASLTDIRSQLYVRGEDRDAILAEIRERGIAIGRECRIRRRDGGELWASISARAVQDASGTSTHIEGCLSDIGDRKRAEEDRRRVHERLEERTSELAAANSALAADIEERRRVEERLRSLVDEKSALIREIHHRVMNNLQVINSILSLGSSYVSDQSAVAMFRRCQGRIVAMSLVHEGLYRSPDLANIDLRDYVDELISEIVRTEPRAGGIELSNEVPRLHLSIETAVPCGLALSELVSNAVAHAFPRGWSGERRVVVSASRGPGGLSLVVSDTGVGLPPDFDPSSAITLGFQIACTAVKQISGRLSAPSARGGAELRIELPGRFDLSDPG